MPKKKEYKIEIYSDSEGLWRFRVVAPNGRIVADSGQGYRTKYFCTRNANRLKAQMETADLKYK